MEYWQIGAGSSGRDYTKVAIRSGMAFVGADKNEAMKQVTVGDRVILKSGKSIVAVGEVVERTGRHSGYDDKSWLKHFDGWQLPAWCYVDWHELPNRLPDTSLVVAAIARVYAQHLRDEVDRLLVNLPMCQDFSEPPETRKIKDDELLSFLIEQGLRAQAADEVTVALRRIRLLSGYYTEHAWDDVGEHEARTFLVIPLLIALGWAEQQLKIELFSAAGRIDVACYDRPFAADNARLVLVIETKSLRQGLDYANGQAKAYAKSLPYCQVILASNGYCYKAFRRAVDGTFSDQSCGYLNLLDPQDRYPLDPCNVDGSLEVLRLLLPSSHR